MSPSAALERSGPPTIPDTLDIPNPYRQGTTSWIVFEQGQLAALDHLRRSERERASRMTRIPGVHYHIHIDAPPKERKPFIGELLAFLRGIPDGVAKRLDRLADDMEGWFR